MKGSKKSLKKDGSAFDECEGIDDLRSILGRTICEIKITDVEVIKKIAKGSKSQYEACVYILAYGIYCERNRQRH